MSNPPSQPNPPKEQFDIVELIGKGPLARVEKVYHRGIDEFFAMKTFDNQELKTENFDKELTSIMRCLHPGLVQLSKVNTAPPGFHFINSLMPNGNLQKYIDAEKGGHPGLTITQKYIIIYGIACSMEFLHLNNLYHRDLKPTNVLLDSNFYPVLSDFGFTKILSLILKSPEALQASLPYIAPEALEGEIRKQPYSYSSDVYSYAMVVYSLLTLSSPFPNTGDLVSLRSSISQGARPELKPSTFLTESVIKLLTDCWNPDPSSRPTFHEIVRRFRESEVKFNGVDPSLVSRFTYFFPTNLPTACPPFPHSDCEKLEVDMIDDVEAAANDGNRHAIRVMGRLYLIGDENACIFKDSEMALEWFKKGAALNDASCLYHLADMQYKSGDFAGAAQTMKAAVDAGDLSANYNLGLLYLRGDGVTKNEKKAFECIEAAAAGGDGIAIYQLALMYHKGVGCEKNLKNAEKYYKKATRLGCVDAFHGLGKLFMDAGEPRKAFPLFIFAAQKGYIDSMYQAGMMLADGIGVVRNPKEAQKLLQSAMKAGHKAAIPELAFLLDEEGDPECLKIFEEAKKAEYYPAIHKLGLLKVSGKYGEKDEVGGLADLEKAAEAGVVLAIAAAGTCYENGIGTNKDLEKAKKYYDMFMKSMGNDKEELLAYGKMLYQSELPCPYPGAMALERAGELGSDKALIMMADMMKNGGNLEGTLEYLLKAANKGNPVAMLAVAKMLVRGKGTQKTVQNVKEGVKWAKKALEKGNGKAAVFLGELSINGTDVEKDEEKGRRLVKRGIEMMEEAGRNGNDISLMYLSKWYSKGKHVEKDDEKSKQYLEQAAKLGNPLAIFSLEEK